ncbi:MAG TPA: TraM recognition domain-containing protein [Propionicimonas sp.]|nr:TraM recognition domain-containing protein [Propionicimonas sp.]
MVRLPGSDDRRRPHNPRQHLARRLPRPLGACRPTRARRGVTWPARAVRPRNPPHRAGHPPPARHRGRCGCLRVVGCGVRRRPHRDSAQARRTLARSQLDPPLLLALDEIGNLAPLPSLPTLMAEGGGTGITTMPVLQSPAQARDRWSEHQAGAIWDASIVKIILGGASTSACATTSGARHAPSRSTKSVRGWSGGRSRCSPPATGPRANFIRSWWRLG